MGCFKITCYLAVVIAVLFPLLLSYLIGGWVRKYTSIPGFTQNDIPDLTGKVAIVTGANTGIGFESALEMARNGAKVILCARSPEKGEAAAAKIRKEISTNWRGIKGAGDVTFMQLDLSSFKSIEQFSSKWISMKLPLHILMLNAGVMKSPGEVYVGQKMTYGFETTEDGFEYHIGVNHIGHQYLTSLIQKTLTAPARVISVSSAAEMSAYEGGFRYDLWRTKGQDYEDGKAYGQSKLANIMFTRELAERMEGTGVTAYSCHPGVIKTELTRYMENHMKSQAADQGWIFLLLNAVFARFFDSILFSQQDGALTQLHLATTPKLPVNGGFYHPIGQLVNASHPSGNDVKKQKELWSKTQEAIRSVHK